MSKVMFGFTGERFIVTGASSGMGREIAIALAEAGAMVLAIARREALLETLRAAYPRNIKTAALDVCDQAAIEEAIENFVAANGKLNGLVHAAGFSGMTPLKIFDEKLAHQMMEVHLWAGIHLLKLATKSRYAQSGSAAVLFSSVSGHSGEKGMLAYSAAKAALQVAAKSAAKEIASKGHRVNTISPGWMRSELTERMENFSDMNCMLGRHLLGMGKSQDVVGMVLFLLSDLARWITGTDVAVDGGFLA